MATFYKANQKYNATLTTSYTVSDTSLNVTSIPSNVPTIITVARGTDKETRFTVTGTASGQLTGVTRLDGANDDISSGSSVECMNDEEYVNQLESAVFDQSGFQGLVYAADGGSNDTYAITLPVPPGSLANLLGIPVAFKANTDNTGAATLNVNLLGDVAIKKNGTEDLASGDIQASQVVTVVYDGTNFQLQTTPPVRSYEVSLQIVDSETDLETGDGKFNFPIPAKLNGMNLTSVYASTMVAGVTGTTDVQIHNVTQAADMLSTKITIDTGEKTSDTAATPAVIDTGNDDVATKDELRIDIDAVSTGTAPKGLMLLLGFSQP